MSDDKRPLQGSPTITIGKDSYRFDPNLMRWYCCHSPSWLRRNMMCYMELNGRLTRQAISMGYEPIYFFPKAPVIEKKKPSVKRKSKSKEMFIKIDL